MAIVGKADPDVIVGYDLDELDVLLYRTIENKIPHWSRLGKIMSTEGLFFALQ